MCWFGTVSAAVALVVGVESFVLDSRSLRVIAVSCRFQGCVAWKEASIACEVFHIQIVCETIQFW